MLSILREAEEVMLAQPSMIKRPVLDLGDGRTLLRGRRRGHGPGRRRRGGGASIVLLNSLLEHVLCGVRPSG